MAGQVQGKVALVTGGASGIGAAVSELLAREGASVAVTDVDDLNGPEVVARIKKAGGEATFLHHDVTSEAEWIDVVAEVMKRYGRLDVLVSNAGIGIAVPSITLMSLEDWRRQTAINLDGVFLSVKHCLPAMRKTGGGSVIMMSSLAGLRGAAALSGYCATKGGVRLFAKAIAMECATFGDGIRVNSVHPGIIDTPIWGKIPTEATGAGQNAPIDPEERAKMATPLGRAGEAMEIAQGVLYLASDASRYVTGTELVIDGGMNAGGVVRGSSGAKHKIRSPDERSEIRGGARVVPDVASLIRATKSARASRPAATAPAPSARHSHRRARCPSGSDNPSRPAWCRCRRGRRCRRCRSRPWSGAFASPEFRPSVSARSEPGKGWMKGGAPRMRSPRWQIASA